jgi:hypothetical protein
MATVLTGTPVWADPINPGNYCYWLATESPNLFSFLTDEHLTYPGFYIEARLTVNGIQLPDQMNIIASPNVAGVVNLDVSGVLRTVTSLGKDGDYTARIMKEETKSGTFTFEYRTRWFGKSAVEAVNPFIAEASPSVNWYYGECVRSEEQGSNLHDFVADAYNDAPFLNLFDQPVLFVGLPWDISFILPELFTSGLGTDMTVSIRFYNSANAPVGVVLNYSTDVDLTSPSISLDGHICSLTVDQTLIPAGATYFTAEITAP